MTEEHVSLDLFLMCNLTEQVNNLEESSFEALYPSQLIGLVISVVHIQSLESLYKIFFFNI